MNTDTVRRIRELEEDVAHLERVVSDLIAWISHATNSPLTLQDARLLLHRIAEGPRVMTEEAP